jgi:hypothetical protein
MLPSELPKGGAPPPVNFPHFPNRLHAYIWRNWQLVPAERLAKVVGAELSDILRIGKSMGLPLPPRVTADQQRRSHLTIIKRNWHLLPYEQMLELLGWTPERMAYTLREDDFFFIKLGSLKPQCELLKYHPLDEKELGRERAIARIFREEFGGGGGLAQDALFGFVSRLSQPAIDSLVTRRDARLRCRRDFALPTSHSTATRCSRKRLTPIRRSPHAWRRQGDLGVWLCRRCSTNSRRFPGTINERALRGAVAKSSALAHQGPAAWCRRLSLPQ